VTIVPCRFHSRSLARILNQADRADEDTPRSPAIGRSGAVDVRVAADR